MKLFIKRVLCIVFLIVNPLFSSGSIENFEKANSLYRQNNFPEAIKIYEGLSKSGYKDFRLFYNLGNAYFKVGKVGLAILNYEKAFKLNSTDEDIRNNLLVARNKLIDKIDVVPEFFLYDWFNKLKDFQNLNGWSLTSLILFIVFLLLLSNLIIFRKINLFRTNLFFIFLISFLFLFCSMLTVIKLIDNNNDDKAIVVQKVVNVKSSPSNNSSDSFIIHEGLKIKIEDKLEDWLKIRLDDGKTGWLKIKEIEII